MTNKKDEFLREVKAVINASNDLLKRYYEYDELDIDFGKSPDDQQVKDVYDNFLYQLQKATNETDFLKYPVESESTLAYDSNLDRIVYNGHDLHCGETLEVLIDDEVTETVKWVSTRIEYNPEITHSNGWYLVGYNRKPLDGLKARMRHFGVLIY